MSINCIMQLLEMWARPQLLLIWMLVSALGSKKWKSGRNFKTWVNLFINTGFQVFARPVGDCQVNVNGSQDIKFLWSSILCDYDIRAVLCQSEKRSHKKHTIQEAVRKVRAGAFRRVMAVTSRASFSKENSRRPAPLNDFHALPFPTIASGWIKGPLDTSLVIKELA